MYTYNYSSFLQAWLYFNSFSCQVSQNFKPFSQIEIQNKIFFEAKTESHESLIIKPAYQFHPIILSSETQKPIKKSNIDEEYIPQEVKEKKAKVKKQDENRNVIPNTIHQIISFIQKKNKSVHIVSKIFDKYQHKAQFTINRYYLYQLKLKEKINYYVNQNTLSILNQMLDKQCHVYSLEQQQFYMKVTRVLVEHFLNNQSPTMVLTSKRMSYDKKKQHISVRRQIRNQLLKIYN